MNTVINNHPLQKIEKIYKETKSIKKTAEIIECSTDLLYKIFKQERVPILSTDNQIMSLKEDYFQTINSDTKAYWLGYIFVAGELLIDYFRVGFEVEHENKYHISKFCDTVGYSKSRIRKDKKRQTLFLRIRSEDFFGYIQYYIGNKRKLEETLKKIPEEYYDAFLRGYFDGSGSIKYKTKENEFEVEFYGNNEDLEYINKIIPEQGTIIDQKLVIKGLKEVCDISDYLYDEECSIRLLKNYNRFVHYKKVLLGEDLEEENFNIANV